MTKADANITRRAFIAGSLAAAMAPAGPSPRVGTPVASVIAGLDPYRRYVPPGTFSYAQYPRYLSAAQLNEAWVRRLQAAPPRMFHVEQGNGTQMNAD